MNGSRTDCSDTFADKVRLFSRDYLSYARFILSPQAPVHGHEYTKKLLSKMAGTSQVLEDFLDYHGAKNNAQWYLYRELCAAVRHLSLGAYCQKHILTRLGFYRLGDATEFEARGKAALEFLIHSLRRVADLILQEAARLEIQMPERVFTQEDFPPTTTCDRLPHDIDMHEERENQSRHIVKIASEFLGIANDFERHRFYEAYGLDDIRQLVPDVINEVNVRRNEMLVHNLQSSFDTYVSQGGFSVTNEHLKILRSHFSVVFHLLQMMGRLLHFYERHLHEAGKDFYQRVQSRMCELMEPERLLDVTINYGLYYACHYLSAGQEVARELLNQHVERGVITVGVPVPRGFHSRPSLMVAKIVQHYGGRVELVINGNRFDASSVLDLQWAGGKIRNESLTHVAFEGDARSLRDLEILARVNYGEDSMGNNISLPREIRYLRD